MEWREKIIKLVETAAESCTSFFGCASFCASEKGKRQKERWEAAQRGRIDKARVGAGEGKDENSVRVLCVFEDIPS